MCWFGGVCLTGIEKERERERRIEEPVNIETAQREIYSHMHRPLKTFVRERSSLITLFFPIHEAKLSLTHSHSAAPPPQSPRPS